VSNSIPFLTLLLCCHLWVSNRLESFSSWPQGLCNYKTVSIIFSLSFLSIYRHHLPSSFILPLLLPAGNFLKILVRPLLFYCGTAYQYHLLITGHRGWKYFGLVFLMFRLSLTGSWQTRIWMLASHLVYTQPRNLLERDDVTASPKSIRICLSATRSQLVEKFLRVSQISCWVQITLSNVKVGNNSSSVKGAQQHLHPM